MADVQGNGLLVHILTSEVSRASSLRSERSLTVGLPWERLRTSSQTHMATLPTKDPRGPGGITDRPADLVS